MRLHNVTQLPIHLLSFRLHPLIRFLQNSPESSTGEKLPRNPAQLTTRAPAPLAPAQNKPTTHAGSERRKRKRPKRRPGFVRPPNPSAGADRTHRTRQSAPNPAKPRHLARRRKTNPNLGNLPTTKENPPRLPTPRAGANRTQIAITPANSRICYKMLQIATTPASALALTPTSSPPPPHKHPSTGNPAPENET